MSFALLLSTFFTSIFTSIPRTDNSISPPSFCHSETRIGTLSLVNSDNRCSTYRIDGLNSVCLEERGEGVRSETAPTHLHLILKRNAVIRYTIRQMLDEQKKLQGRLIARKNKALRMDVGWRSDIEIPVKYVCHHPAESDRSLGDPK